VVKKRSTFHANMEVFSGYGRNDTETGQWLEIRFLLFDNAVDQIGFLADGPDPLFDFAEKFCGLVLQSKIEDVASLNHQSLVQALGDVSENELAWASLVLRTWMDAIRYYLEHEGASTGCNGSCSSCGQSSGCSSAEKKQESAEDLKLKGRLARIKKKIMVISGKGGVGKSTVAVNLAMSLAMQNLSVGLLDIDLHGPSVPTMLGLQASSAMSDGENIIPVEIGSLKVISVGFFLNKQDDAIIWRGPLKMSAIRQFLQDVEWGDLDALVMDLPPGTGDEPLSVCQLFGSPDGAVIVTTPQEVASADVRKSINFCHQLNIPVLGVVENMNGFVCPHCGETTQIFPSGGGKKTAEKMNVPFFGSLPIDPSIASESDQGRCFIVNQEAPSSARFKEVMKPVFDFVKA